MPGDMNDVRSYAKLMNEKLEADAILKALNANLTDLMPAVLDFFQGEGVDQIVVDGRTLYLRRELHTSKSTDVSMGQACDKLREMMIPEYVGEKYSPQGLSAYVRELEQDGQKIEDIQEEFGEFFNIREVFKIGSRKR